MKKVPAHAFDATATALAELRDGLQWLDSLKPTDDHYGIVVPTYLELIRRFAEVVDHLLTTLRTALKVAQPSR